MRFCILLIIFYFNHLLLSAQIHRSDYVPAIDNSSNPVVKSDTIWSRLNHRTSVDGQLSTGNTNRLLLVTRNQFDIKYRNWLDLNSLQSYSYGHTNFVLAENDWFTSFAAQYRPIQQGRLVGWLVYGSAEGSHLRFIDHRIQLGAGPAFKIYHRHERDFLNFNCIAMLDNTEFYADNGGYSTWRASVRIKGSHPLFNQKFHLVHESFIQPSVQTASNYRFKTFITVEYLLYRGISFKLTLTESYDSVVYPDKRHDDLQVLMGFVLSSF